jgi:hypothetical protein
MGTITIIILGAVGGLLPDLIRVIKIKNKKIIPVYFHYIMFWITLLIMVVLGGFTAWLFAATSPIQAVACGFSAPEILSRVLAKNANEIDRSVPGFDPRNWWGE